MLLPNSALVLPESDVCGARALAAAYGKHVLERLWGFNPAHLAPGLQPAWGELVEAVREAHARDASATEGIVRHPSISALVVCLQDRARASQCASELVPLLGFELALAGLLFRPLDVRWDVRWLHSVERNVLVTLRVPTRTGFTSDGIWLRPTGRRECCLPLDVALLAELNDEVAVGQRAFPRVCGDLVLALCDGNPLATVEAHPEKSGNRLDLGGRTVDEWRLALEAALELIAGTLPLLRQEMPLLLRQIVPVGYSAETHLSASYREAVGTAYLTLHPWKLTMAEALIHEFQHNKLNAALAFDPLIENSPDELVRSPVRPDLRPVLGVLLAVHAFVPVAELFRRLLDAEDLVTRDPGFLRRMREVVDRNEEGLTLLQARARPTQVGQAILNDLAVLHARSRSVLVKVSDH